jgi:hypothetical protein
VTAAIRIPVTGPLEDVDAPVDDPRLLADCCGAPWLDFITARAYGVIIGVDDEGLLKGLPINPRATGLMAWLRGSAEVTGIVPPLVGPALVFGIDEAGESVDIPPLVADLLHTADEAFRR